MQMYFGDCLDILPTLAEHTIDAVITDLPYGTTQAAFDSVIPLEPMWQQVARILKPDGIFVTTASQPFSSLLVMSNLAWFRYEWIYEKPNAKGFLSAQNRPLTAHEQALVFAPGSPPYYPQKWRMPEYLRVRRKHATTRNTGAVYGDAGAKRWEEDGWRFPTSVIGFANHTDPDNALHPTQKPVALFRYLIETYTRPGQVVLDIAAGSGTTGIAALETGRACILIEKDPQMFAVMQRRILHAENSQPLFSLSTLSTTEQ